MPKKDDILTIEIGLITSIGNNAFADFSKISEILIPSSVKTIENNAFNGCSGITKITIENGITTMNQNVFTGLIALKEVIYLGNNEPSSLCSKSAFDTSLIYIEVPITYEDFIFCGKNPRTIGGSDNKCGDSCNWEYYHHNSTVNIWGSNTMKSFEQTSMPWYDQITRITSVIIHGVENV